MGTHIDGYITVAAHSVIVPEAPSEDLSGLVLQGKLADVINATYIAAEVATKVIKV